MRGPCLGEEVLDHQLVDVEGGLVPVADGADLDEQAVQRRNRQELPDLVGELVPVRRESALVRIREPRHDLFGVVDLVGAVGQRSPDGKTVEESPEDEGVAGRVGRDDVGDLERRVGGSGADQVDEGLLREVTEADPRRPRRVVADETTEARPSIQLLFQRIRLRRGQHEHRAVQCQYRLDQFDGVVVDQHCVVDHDDPGNSTPAQCGEVLLCASPRALRFVAEPAGDVEFHLGGFSHFFSAFLFELPP